MSGKDSNLHGSSRPRSYGPVPCRMGVRSVVGLAGRIRTCGLLVPNEVRWPAALQRVGGDGRSPTDALLLARQALSRLSYVPMAEGEGVEPSTRIGLATVFETVCSHERHLPNIWHSRPDSNRHTRLEGPRSSPLDDGNNIWCRQQVSNPRLDAGNVALCPLSHVCTCVIHASSRAAACPRGRSCATSELSKSKPRSPGRCAGAGDAKRLLQTLVPHPGFEPGVARF
jgi:hypothetical protein